jgi:hypothetical protein
VVFAMMLGVGLELLGDSKSQHKHLKIPIIEEPRDALTEIPRACVPERLLSLKMIEKPDYCGTGVKY